MRDGADVIFQATFFDGRWRGHADFLFKRPDRPSPALGSWSYDIADTKLARSVKGGAILQMCVYADLLAAVQGIAPEWLYVITGDGVRHPYPHRRLLGVLPSRSGAVRRPRLERTRWRRGRHLSRSGRSLPRVHLVPHVHRPATRRRPPLDRGRDAPRGHRTTDRGRHPHARRARGPGAGSVDRWDRDSPTDPRPRTGPAATRLPVDDTSCRSISSRRIRTMPVEACRILPTPSPWDVFFDIEADPWATEVGLEYLLGVVEEHGRRAQSIGRSGRRRRRRRRPHSSSSSTT